MIGYARVSMSDQNPRLQIDALIAAGVNELDIYWEQASGVGVAKRRQYQAMMKDVRQGDIVGDVRAKGCLMGIELVKDRTTKEPFDKAGTLVYQKAFRKGLAWIPAGHILRMSPPIVMDEDTLLKGLDLIDESIGETAKELGYS